MAKFTSVKPSPDAPGAPAEETVVASNPFDDPPTSGNKQVPSCNPLVSSFMPPNAMLMMQRPYYMARAPPPYGHMPLHHHLTGPPMPSIMEQRVYPPEQSMIRSTNPNAPPTYICRCCRLEIHDNEQTLFCGAECKRFFHRSCVGMNEDAWVLLNNEAFAEWICDHCFDKRGRPMVRVPQGHQPPPI